ncbi:cupin domain-containing protein [Dongia sp.]|uniref:AraC family transcriptional regulator n=1 Tax=Dongia sp. TaxID=1977262 RepID=UPI0035B38C1B
MAGSLKGLIKTPPVQELASPGLAAAGADVLSDVLRHIRLSGSLQFCFMANGVWMTDDKPSLKNLGAKDAGAKALGSSGTIPFHIVVDGDCWMKMEGRHVELVPGDVVAFPFGTGHQLGAGSDGGMIKPVDDLPPKPWRDIPTLHYGSDGPQVRILCGYLQCDAMSFEPLRKSLPSLLHVRTRADADATWLKAAIGQIVAEFDRPRSGGAAILERLTEVTFIELLRHRMHAAATEEAGWLAALSDPALARCLALVHEDPAHDWSVEELAARSGLSRSALAERFDAVLGIAPMRYVRAWRLSLARSALRSGTKGVSAIAFEAGYGTEAAFNRAFARAYGVPPATWRQAARQNS